MSIPCGGWRAVRLGGCLPQAATTLFTVAAIFGLVFPLNTYAESGDKLQQWITRIGGGVYGEVVAIGPEGRIYLAGISAGGQVPVTPNAYQGVAASKLWYQGFLLALNESGTAVLYGTYINVTPLRMTVDVNGYVYVLAKHVEPDNYLFSPMGGRFSYAAPITPNAAQVYPGQLTDTPILLKFSPVGELIYGTYLGGEGAVVNALAVDSHGAATVCGEAIDPFLPVSMRAVQVLFRGPSDAFVARVSPDGTRFEALTYLGGAGGDGCADVKIDASGNVILFGQTNSHAFPASPEAYQKVLKGSENLFAAKLDANFERLVWSTYIGSGGEDRAQFLNLTPDGSLILAGWTASVDFPVTPGTSPPFVVDARGFRASHQPFVATLDSEGTRLRSALVLPFEGRGFVGASMAFGSLLTVGWAYARDISVNSTLNVVSVEGFGQDTQESMSPFLMRINAETNVPTYLGPLPFNGMYAFTALGFGTLNDGAMIISGPARLSYSDVPVRSIGSGVSTGLNTALARLEFPRENSPSLVQVVNAASLIPGPISPGEIVEVRGVGMGCSSPARVLIGGQLVLAVPASDESIMALAPDTFGGESSVSLAVECDGLRSEARYLRAAATNPGLFTASQTGAGPALAEAGNGALNSPQKPALRGGILRLFATGLGPAPVIAATIAGFDAPVKAVGPAPGRPEGYTAIDLVVPLAGPPGDYLDVRVRANGITSQPGVTVAVR